MARAIQAQGIDDPNTAYLGCSAGALAAVGLALDGNLNFNNIITKLTIYILFYR